MTVFQTAAQMTGRPYNNHFAILGDSRTFEHVIDDGTNYHLAARGYANWVRFLTGQRIWWDPTTDNFGVNGDNTADILARTSAALAASDASVWFVLAGTNDREQGLTGAQTIANLTAIRDLIIAAGRLVIFLAEMPRGDSTFTGERLAGTQLDYHLATHLWLMTQRDIPGVYVADPWPSLASPASTNGDAVVGMMYDGLHPACLGGFNAASSVAAIINALFPPAAHLPASNTGLYSANNTRGWLNANPMLTGTGGIKAIGTGNLADSWTNDGTLGSMTLAYSKVTSGGKDWQQIVLGGTAGGSFALLNLLKITPSAVNLSVGDELEGVCEMEVDAGTTGANCFGLRVYEADSAPNNKSAMDMAYSNGPLPGSAFSGVLRVPKAAIGSTNIRFALTFNPEASAAVNATVRVRGMGLHKVTI